MSRDFSRRGQVQVRKQPDMTNWPSGVIAASIFIPEVFTWPVNFCFIFPSNAVQEDGPRGTEGMPVTKTKNKKTHHPPGK